MSKDQRCKLPADTEGTRIDDAWVTTDAACKTSVYLSVDLDPNSSLPDFKLRRYTLSQLEPCELVRDATVPEVVVGAAKIAADDAGNVYRGAIYAETTNKGVMRVAPGAPVLCTNTGNISFSTRDAAAITMARDGKVGYFAHLNINTDDDPKLVKITTDANGCAMTALPVTGVTLTGTRALAIDGKGRLHVADDKNSNGNKRFVILEDKGTEAAFVAEYTGAPPNETITRVSGINACAAGLCLEASATTTGFIVANDDGAFVRAAMGYSAEVATSNTVLRSGAIGPMFYLGGEMNTTHLYVGILKDR